MLQVLIKMKAGKAPETSDASMEWIAASGELEIKVWQRYASPRLIRNTS